VTGEARPQSRFRVKLAKLAFRLIVVVLVGFGIAHTVAKAWHELEAQQRFSLGQISAAWLLAAAIFYLLGLLPCWWYWHQTLKSMGQRPRLAETLRAYYVGHLGKYVPGKVMVVVIRAGGLPSERVDTTVAAASVFVETFTTMAVGAFVAATILLLTTDQMHLILLAIALMLGSGVPTLPPIFRQIVRTIQLKRLSGNIEAAIGGLSFRLAATGWISISLGWFLLGLSLWATIKALPGAAHSPEGTLSAILMLTATVSLALVAGFLSLLPGGVGVREYVIMSLVAPQFGSLVALCSALLLRVVWLISELLISTILYVLIRR
jgi:hypothetical protein